jgi:hypothetical protein
MDVANTLQEFATMWTKPGDRMMGQLERRAKGFQLAGCCKHAAGVCDNVANVGGDDGAAGGAGGGDIRKVQLAGGCKLDVGVCDKGGKAGGAIQG